MLAPLLLSFVTVTEAPAQGRETGLTEPAGILETTVNTYCFGCHNDSAKIAGLTLAGLSSSHVAAQASILEKVLLKVRAGEMPPAGRTRPDANTVANLVGWLETELDRVAAEQPNPGAPAIHRLNRAEYGNAVRDLLWLDLDHAQDLPADDSGYGFDNIGDVLTVSPLHIEKYISAARRISRLAVGTGTPRPVVEKFSPPRGTRDEALGGLPPNERGGIVFRHYFGFDADYSIQVRGRGRRVPGIPAPKLDVRVDGKRVEILDADFDTYGLQDFEVRLSLNAGDHEIGAGFLTEYVKGEASESSEVNGFSVDYVLVGGPFNSTGPGNTQSRRRIFACRPVAGQAEEPCARQILTRLARRAYRRPVTTIDLDPLVALFRAGRADGAGFDDGIEMALSGVLISPNFLFRSASVPDAGEPGSVYRISDVDLASRLSFFLWSSIPDDQLLRLAEQGRLSDPDVFDGQVARMIADPKAQSLVDNFGGQWLQLRNIEDWTPDPERFAEFDDSIRFAFQRETALFLENLVREDRSVLELINADYTFVNERLADFYGIEGVEGGYFRRVSLAGTARGGVLTHGSLLTVTSYPTRTSPVLRGKWILENLLGVPPPAPPPDVPTLSDSAENSASGLREALELPRAIPACASCHARLDPMGFALENFDAVGLYRTEDDGVSIEVSGKLPDGTLVDGLRGLQRVVLARRVEFVETLAEKLLTYALGRGLDFYDQPAVREIRRRVESQDYRFSALVGGIVDSVPFRFRRIPES